MVEGACVEVTCSTPPAVPHAEPLWDPERGNVSTGLVGGLLDSETSSGSSSLSCFFSNPFPVVVEFAHY